MIQGKLNIIDVKTSSKVEYTYNNDEIITLTCFQENLKIFSKIPESNVH